MDWIAAPIAAGVVLAWLAIVVLVHHDQGDVGVSEADLQRLRVRGAMAKVSLAVGEHLVPAMRRMTAELVKLNAALEKMRRVA